MTDKEILKRIADKHPRLIIREHALMLLRMIDRNPELHEDVKSLLRIGNIKLKTDGKEIL